MAVVNTAHAAADDIKRRDIDLGATELQNPSSAHLGKNYRESVTSGVAKHALSRSAGVLAGGFERRLAAQFCFFLPGAQLTRD